MKASDYIIELLSRIGVKQIYGFQGGAVTHIYDSLYKSKIRMMSCYHEQAASFAASAMAKLTQELQVAIATSGPGATNLITGIADSFFDSTPVLFITGQVNTYDINIIGGGRQRGFQETDIVSLVRPITKYCKLITSVDELEPELKKAIIISLSGRKGPVLLDIPMDVQRKEVMITESSFDIDLPKEIDEVTPGQMDSMISEIKKSRHPLILAGGGMSAVGRKDLLVEFAERYSIPVVVSLLGKDSFPHDHQLFGGFIGAYGNRYGNILLAKSDLLIVLGSRMDSRQTGNILNVFEIKKIIKVDVDPTEISSSKVHSDMFIRSSVVPFLEKMIAHAPKECLYPDKDKYLDVVKNLKDTYTPESEFIRAGKPFWHYEILDKISRHFRKDDVFCVDIGQIQMLGAQMLQIKGDQRFITSGGMAPMGFSIPAAAGISQASDKRCITLTGDGGAQMNIQEFNNIARNNLPVVMIILNNHSLGMIKQFQELYFERRFAGTDMDSGYFACDFVKVGEAYGIKGWKIDRKEKDVDSILKEAFSVKGPVILELDIDYETQIYPKLRFDLPIDKISPELDGKENDAIDKMFR